MHAGMNISYGKVYLVGLARRPGAAHARAAECLAEADVVLYDYLLRRNCCRIPTPARSWFALGDTDMVA